MALDNPFASCKWDELSTTQGKLLDASVMCALDACIPDAFPPALYQPLLEVTMPSGTQLVGPFSSGAHLSTDNFFLNYQEMKIASEIELSLEDGYIVGQLPVTSSVKRFKIQLLAVNKQGSTLHELWMILLPRNKHEKRK